MTLTSKYGFFIVIIIGSSIGGIARLWYEDENIPIRRFIGAVILNGFAGLIAGLCLYETMVNSPFLLMGLSLVCGLMGVEFLSRLFQLVDKKLRAKADIKITPKDSEN